MPSYTVFSLPEPHEGWTARAKDPVHDQVGVGRNPVEALQGLLKSIGYSTPDDKSGMCGSPSYVKTDDETYHPKCGACPEPVLPGQYYFVAGRRDPQDIDSDQKLMVHAYHFMGRQGPGIVLD